MQHRPLEQRDLDAGESWMAEVELRADRWRDETTRSLVGLVEGRVAVAGAVWISPVHPSRFWFTVVTDPARRRRGLGTAAFRALSALRPDRRPFTARGHVDDAGMRFADALGARTIQLVPPPMIDPRQRAVLRPWAGLIKGSEVPFGDVSAAKITIYDWTHQEWSPVGPDFADAVRTELHADADLGSTIVARHTDGRIRAVSIVYRDTPPTVTAECVDPHDPDGERVLEGCVRETLEVLAARGVRQVQFDGHVSDPYFLPVWARLSPAGRWTRIVEIP